MKSFKNVFVIALVNICFCQFGFCQNNNAQNQRGDVRRDSTAKKNFLNEILGAIATNLADPNKKVVPTEKYARIEYEFRRQKIYPSGDALELMYVLNPWLEDADTIATTTDFKMPVFPWLNSAVKRKMKDDYRAGSKVDATANARFDSLFELTINGMDDFIQRFNAFVKSNSVDENQAREFLDTLRGFTVNFLPLLKQRSRSIGKSKMDYINNNLTDLGNCLNGAEQLNNETLSLIQYVIRDFVATNDIRLKTYTGINSQVRKPLFLNASYSDDKPRAIRQIRLDSPESESDYSDDKVLKCRVYIYTSSGEVMNKKFQVYFAPYVTVYNMDRCQDVLQCLRDRGCIEANAASTAAAAIPNNSNWAIYCIDTNNRAFLVNEEFNYQNIINKDETEEGSFKILLIYHGNANQ